MKFRQLIEELILASQKTKTDFALSMYMTPSGLSKMLNSKNLPFLKEKYLFREQAAEFFAEAIYETNCYFKLSNLFPVIYDFNSKHELKDFLALAIEYALDENHLSKINNYMDYSEKGTAYLGRQATLNMSCIIISDYIQINPDTKLEFYSSLYLFRHLYKESVSRIRLSRPGRWNLELNYIIDPTELKTAYDKYDVDYLSLLVKSEQHFGVKLWKTNSSLNPAFVLLKGQLLLVFDLQLDGTPLLSVIRHKQYLSVFHNSLIKRGLSPLSYTKDEATALLQSHPEIRTKIINQKIDSAYSFMPIGYLVEKKDLKPDNQYAANQEIILKLFDNILTQETVFIISLDAMKSCYSSGTVVVPLVGPVHFSSDQLIQYLRRFDPYLSGKNSNNLKAVNGDFPEAAILCTKEFSIIYTADSTFQHEKYHVLKTEVISDFLQKYIPDQAIIDVSADMWEEYIKELSARISLYPGQS